MKNTQILVLLLIGAILAIIGVAFKITFERKNWTTFFNQWNDFRSGYFFPFDSKVIQKKGQYRFISR